MTTPNHHTDITSTRLAVLGITGWNQEELFWFQWEQGIAYLERYLPDDNAGRSILSRSPLFWNWWRIKWHERDQVFAFDALYTPRSLAIELYRYMHDPAELVCEINPPRIITHPILNHE